MDQSDALMQLEFGH